MPSELKIKISSAVKDAMRAKEKNKLTVLRLLMSECKRIEVDERIELDDERVLAILDKQLKQRRESIRQYSEAGRTDLADTEAYEMKIIQEFLPAALTVDEITQLLKEAITQSQAESMRDMGKVMAIIKPKMQGRADMSEVSTLIKELLNK